MSKLSNSIANAIINYVKGRHRLPIDGVPSNEDMLREALHQALDYVNVKIYIDPEAKAKIPEYAHYENGHAVDAACDVCCTSVEIMEDDRIKCGTGIHVAPEDRDKVSLHPNSRITKAGLVIANSPCTVDESYRGEIFVVFRAIVPFSQAKKPGVGDVICQLETIHVRETRFIQVDNLEDLGTTSRGDGGFGSTAK